MVLGISPVMLLVKGPAPKPSVVLEDAVVGFAVVDQHTPFSVTGDPPSLTFPPQTADTEDILVTALVITVGEEIEPPAPHAGIPPLIIRDCPTVPTGSRVHWVPFQYNISPVTVPTGAETATHFVPFQK